MFVLLNIATLQPKAANEVPAPSHDGKGCSVHTVRQMYVEYCWFRLNCCLIRVIWYFIWNLNFSQKHNRAGNTVAWIKERHHCHDFTTRQRFWAQPSFPLLSHTSPALAAFPFMVLWKTYSYRHLLEPELWVLIQSGGVEIKPTSKRATYQQTS